MNQHPVHWTSLRVQLNPGNSNLQGKQKKVRVVDGKISKTKKSLYLRVNVFSRAVLIEDTVNNKTNIANRTETF